MLEEMEFEAPVPMETIAMTELIPMTIPRTVSPDLTLFAESAVYVSDSTSLMFIKFNDTKFLLPQNFSGHGYF